MVVSEEMVRKSVGLVTQKFVCKKCNLWLDIKKPCTLVCLGCGYEESPTEEFMRSLGDSIEMAQLITKTFIHELNKKEENK